MLLNLCCPGVNPVTSTPANLGNSATPERAINKRAMWFDECDNVWLQLFVTIQLEGGLVFSAGTDVNCRQCEVMYLKFRSGTSEAIGSETSQRRVNIVSSVLVVML